MPDKLVLLPEARQDIAEAYSWYEGQAPGLGMDFIRCLEVAILSIERRPQVYPVVHENYRRALVRRFPYAIFFERDSEQIVIYSIFHCSQDPQKWRDRLTN
jgi:plasmid stabilization system protein ParE